MFRQRFPGGRRPVARPARVRKGEGFRAGACRRAPGAGRRLATLRKEDPEKEARRPGETRVPAKPRPSGGRGLLEVARAPLRGSAPPAEKPDRGGPGLRPGPEDAAGGPAFRPRRPDRHQPSGARPSGPAARREELALLLDGGRAEAVGTIQSPVAVRRLRGIDPLACPEDVPGESRSIPRAASRSPRREDGRICSPAIRRPRTSEPESRAALPNCPAQAESSEIRQNPYVAVCPLTPGRGCRWRRRGESPRARLRRRLSPCLPLSRACASARRRFVPAIRHCQTAGQGDFLHGINLLHPIGTPRRQQAPHAPPGA